MTSFFFLWKSDFKWEDLLGTPPKKKPPEIRCPRNEAHSNWSRIKGRFGFSTGNFTVLIRFPNTLCVDDFNFLTANSTPLFISTVLVVFFVFFFFSFCSYEHKFIRQKVSKTRLQSSAIRVILIIIISTLLSIHRIASIAQPPLAY